MVETLVSGGIPVPICYLLSKESGLRSKAREEGLQVIDIGLKRTGAVLGFGWAGRSCKDCTFAGSGFMPCTVNIAL